MSKISVHIKVSNFEVEHNCKREFKSEYQLLKAADKLTTCILNALPPEFKMEVLECLAKEADIWLSSDPTAKLLEKEQGGEDNG